MTTPGKHLVTVLSILCLTTNADLGCESQNKCLTVIRSRPLFLAHGSRLSFLPQSCPENSTCIRRRSCSNQSCFFFFWCSSRRSRDFLAWLYSNSTVKDDVVVDDRWGTDARCHHGGYFTCQDRYQVRLGILSQAGSVARPGHAAGRVTYSEA